MAGDAVISGEKRVKRLLMTVKEREEELMRVVERILTPPPERTTPSTDKLLQIGDSDDEAVYDEARAVRDHLRSWRKDPMQSPSDSLDRVRELVEDLGAYVIEHRREMLRPYISRIREVAVHAVQSGSVEYLERQLQSTHFQGMRSAVGAEQTDDEDKAAWEESWRRAGHRVPSRYGLAVLPCLNLLFRRAKSYYKPGGNGSGSGAGGDAGGGDADGDGDGDGDDDDEDEDEDAAEDGEIVDVEELYIDEATKYLRRLSRRAAQRVVMLPVHPDLMYRAQQCAGAADSLVHSRLAAAHARFPDLPGRLFEVPREMWKRVSRSWDDARASIEAMEMQPLPYMQLEKLIDAARQTTQAITDEKLALSRKVAASRGESSRPGNRSHGPAGADEFLPGFFWVVATAFPHRLATIHSSLQRLLPTPDAKGEVQYLLTHLESAVMFLSRLHLEDDSTPSMGSGPGAGAVGRPLRQATAREDSIVSLVSKGPPGAGGAGMDLEMTEKVGSLAQGMGIGSNGTSDASLPQAPMAGRAAGVGSLARLGRQLSMSARDDQTIPGLTRFADADAEIESAEVRLQFHADHLTVRALHQQAAGQHNDAAASAPGSNDDASTAAGSEDGAGHAGGTKEGDEGGGGATLIQVAQALDAALKRAAPQVDSAMSGAAQSPAERRR